MDPFTAIGLASSVVQFVDFSTKLICGAREIYYSTTGTTEENASLELVVTEMKAWSSKLQYYGPSAQSEEEKAIHSLAAECQKLSDKILELIEKTKPKNQKSKTQVVFAAMIGKLHEDDKLQLQKRLNECGNQLNMQLAALDRSKIKDRLRIIAESAKFNSAELISLQKKVEELQCGVNIKSVSPDVQELLRSLLGGPHRIIAEHHILQALAFEKMRSRFDNVNEAHYKTFQWIFEDLSYAKVNDHQSGVSFVNWLSNGSGIFHIAGKLGSGKSTLMKYLSEHGRTMELLNEWAGTNKKLVFAQFFFWRAGEENQKSLSGLRRSLLYDTLEQCPDLIPSVFPKLWQKMTSLDGRLPVKLNLSKQEIFQAFERLVRNRQVYKNHRVCFFIDGLDEYEETCSEDYSDMVNQLVSWTESALPDVKLCVSSREYEVFRKAFGEDKKLRVQDLTREDIRNFVKERLKGFQILKDNEISVENSESLVEEIVNRADGIFLWVVLVLKSLREGIYYDNRLSSLLQRLKDMPQGMEPLFRYLLESINPTDRRTAYRTLAVVTKLREYECPDMSSFRYTFLEDYEKNANFAMDAGFKDSDAGQAEISSRTEWAPVRLNGQLKGLLEFRHDSKSWSQHFCPQSITFAHRSIFDFVTGKVILGVMEGYCKNFDIVEAVCQSLLAEFKFCGQSSKGLKNLTLEMHKILRLRKASKKDVAPFHFLEILHSACLHIQQKSQNDLRGSRLSLHPLDIDSFSSEVVSVFHMAAGLDYIDYVSWKITQDLTLVSDGVQFGRLFGAINSWSVEEGDSAGIELLLSCLRSGTPLNTHVNIPQMQPFEAPRENIWVLTFAFALWFLPSYQPRGKRLRGELLEMLLKAGADPSLRVQADSSAGDKAEFRFDKDPNRVWVSTGAASKKTREYIMEKGKGVGVTLYELVDFWRLENAETLKKLIDCKIAPKTETLDWAILDSETADFGIADLFALCSEQELKRKDQPLKIEPHMGPDKIKPSEPSSDAVPKPQQEEYAGPQVKTYNSQNNPRRVVNLSIQSPLIIFALGILSALILMRLWQLF